MKRASLHIALVVMLVLAGFSAAPAVCVVGDGPADCAPGCGDHPCLALATAGPMNTGSDDGAGIPGSNEASCESCSLCPDAALAAAVTEFSPAFSSRMFTPAETRPLLAGHAFPLLKPPPR